MPAIQAAPKTLAPQFTLSDDAFNLITETEPLGVFNPKIMCIYGLPKRGKSTFLKSVVDYWGARSIVALDIEETLGEKGVPSVVLPDLSKYTEEQQYAVIFQWWDTLLDRAEKRIAPFSEETRVIAIDTLDKLFQIILDADLARRMIAKGTPRDKWRYEFQWYTSMYADIMKRVNRMKKLKQKGYFTVLVCHALPETTQDDEGANKEVFTPTLPNGLRKAIEFDIDMMLFLKSSDGSRPNFFVTFSKNDVYPAGDRTGKLGPALYPTWSALEATFVEGSEAANDAKHMPRIKLAVKKEAK